MIVVDHQLRVRSVNRAFCESFGVTTSQAEGRGLFDLPADGWDLGQARARLEPVIRDGGSIEPIELKQKVPGMPTRLRMTGRRVEIADGNEFLTLLALEDRSGRDGGELAAWNAEANPLASNCSPASTSSKTW